MTHMSSLKPYQTILVEIVGLQSSRGRLLFFAIFTLIIFVLPYESFAELSLWQHFGVPSPSIGLTRAYWKLIHLDPVGAWERNKLIYVVLITGMPVLIRDAYRLWYNRKSRTHQ